jgi:pyruvate/2-oxoglutarate dehydrogenase complex dihydrolipoamide acyltransferase (E2) component
VDIEFESPYGTETGTLLKWYKKVGDKIHECEDLFDMNTDEGTYTQGVGGVEGVVTGIFFEEGAVCRKGDLLAVIEVLGGPVALLGVWIISTKSRILLEPSLAMNGSKFAYRECFVATPDIKDAIEMVRAALLEEVKFELIDISRCVRFRWSDWNDSSERSGEVLEAVKKAQKLKKVVFEGSF